MRGKHGATQPTHARTHAPRHSDSATLHQPLLSSLPLGLENLFCASRRIFRTEHGCHFSGRIFFQLGLNRVPRLKSLGAKKKKLSLR